MQSIEISKLSAFYNVRKLNANDTEMIFSFCQKNTQYYAYCGKEPSFKLIESDMEITPPGIPSDQKYYIGFFNNDKLVAVLDLIIGYPNDTYVYIGFFMMDANIQGLGIGSKIIADVFEYLHKQGFKYCQLGIDSDNPQSNHFWRKNGFKIIKEISLDDGTVLLAEKNFNI